MCLAIPLRLVSVEGKHAVGEAGGLTQNIRIDFIPGGRTGRLCDGARRVRHRKAHEGAGGGKPGQPAGGHRCVLTRASAARRVCRGWRRPSGSRRAAARCGSWRSAARTQMAIAKAGLRPLLSRRRCGLLSGPGCPVCVTPAGVIDAVLELAARPGVTLVSYGDLLRVPGSARGDTLLRRRALGADVRVAYSPLEAVEIAAREPSREVVFLGVGFETTAPGTAACVLEAAERGLKNFSLLCLLKRDGTGAARAAQCAGLFRGRLPLPRPRGGHHGGGGLRLPAAGIRPARRGGEALSRPTSRPRARCSRRWRSRGHPGS